MDDPRGSGSSAGGAQSSSSSGGRSGSEGVDPELGIDGNGGAGGAIDGTGGAAPGGTGGSSQNAGGGATDTGTGGSGGDSSATGGTRGNEPGIGGTNGDIEQGGSGGQGGDDPGTGGTDGEGPGAGGAAGPVDQGGSGGRGGSDEPPPDVDVDVGECAPFEPCGGDVEGVWTYSGACVDLADLGIAEEDLQAMCAGAELTLAGQVSGTLTFADGVVTRQGRSSAQGQVLVPAFCALGLGGCAGVERELAAAGIIGARCVPQGNLLPDCRCNFTLEAPPLEEVAFVTDGDVILLADGRELRYCVDGDNLTYQEVGTTTEPGVRELQRR